MKQKMQKMEFERKRKTPDDKKNKGKSEFMLQKIVKDSPTTSLYK